jgi:HSP20 family molecular chaperone IbpA
MNQVFLNNIYDGVFDRCSKMSLSSTELFVGDSSIKYPLNTNNYYYPSTWFSNNIWIVLRDYESSELNAPNYPVSNYSIDETGTSLIEIAVTGFDENEIELKREDLKLIIKAECGDKAEDIKRKYFHQKIAKRDFEISYTGSDKWDYDKLTAKLKKGILRIEIPMKDEFKPIKQNFKINK